MGHVATSGLTSSERRGPELRDTWQRQSSPQQGGEVRGRGTCGGTGAHLDREVRSGTVRHVAASEPTSVGRRDLRACGSIKVHLNKDPRSGARDSTRAHLGRELRSWAIGRVAAPEFTSARERGPKLHDTWQCVNAHPTSCLNLKLICGGNRSTGYRQSHSYSPVI
jgi:hypothetical protein